MLLLVATFLICHFFSFEDSFICWMFDGPWPLRLENRTTNMVFRMLRRDLSAEARPTFVTVVSCLHD
jgi:hypothetical protein